MNKKLSMAVAGAVMAMGASAANAGIVIPAGDWTIDIGGNVNAFYSHTKTSGDTGGGYDDGGDTVNDIQTGLLPSALGIGGKTRQNDLDIAFQFTFFVGANSGTQSAAGSNSLNIRQGYLTFGDKSWGTIKLGRDLGIFGSDAILSDMTLLGVGIGAGSNLESSTLGRIGSGYMYADWVGQISYASPNWNGFSFAVGVREPWTNTSDTLSEARHNLGYEGKVSYEWAGDIAGKVWVGGVFQEHETGSSGSYDSQGFEIGAKASMGGLGLVGYYYDGEGLDSINSTGLSGLMFLDNQETDDKGGYVQATYTLPSTGTKLGVSWGTSNSESENSGNFDFENESWMVGVYHPLTKSLNLVAEYVDQDIEDDDNNFDQTNRTFSLGAIMFF
jgi:predicted porin